ncbi:hypothetical protein BD769DRAFT_56934 [Suillus cothurnatus]|nr:hypothetical protein BD769DRAFT_56934 [Suillus cothurnatus]
MQIQTTFCHAAIISGQVIILAFGCGVIGAVLYYNYLSPPDQVSNLWRDYPHELTMVVTVIATVLSLISATLFRISIKEALMHRMLQSISLVHLGAGVSLMRGSITLKFQCWKLTILTLFLSVVLRLLTAGWTTLLTPIYFLWPIQIQGTELDITGINFAILLSNEFQKQGLIDIQDDSLEISGISGMLSRILSGCIYYLHGRNGFNGVKYNSSTHGIVPTIESYSGSHEVPGANRTRLGFCGGNVTTNTAPILGKHTSVSIPQGYSRNYSMLQQGLTANVSCRAIDSSRTQFLWDTNNSNVIDTGAAFRLWKITANCGANMPMTQQYVTNVDASGDASVSSIGFLPSVVCPGPMNMNETYTSFTILSQGFYKYSFLDASVCEVIPLLTTVRANYTNDLISSEVISSTPFRPENVQLLSFIAGVAKFQSINSQTLMINTIGDTLYSVYSSRTKSCIVDHLGSQARVYKELEEYWRGVVEFSATFLRSGFMAVGSFPDNTIPDDLVSKVNGTMYISTIGWTWRSATYLLAIIPIAIITILTCACTLYSILQVRKEDSGYSTAFDPSDTSRLVMASAAGNLTLEDFYQEGIAADEGVKVKLEVSGKDGGVKKFVKAQQETGT